MNGVGKSVTLTAVAACMYLLAFGLSIHYQIVHLTIRPLAGKISIRFDGDGRLYQPLFWLSHRPPFDAFLCWYIYVWVQEEGGDGP